MDIMIDTQANLSLVPRNRTGRVLAPMLALTLAAACGSDSDGSHLVPESLVGQPMLFGGAVIAVSDALDPDLGGLKLRRLSPANVVPSVSQSSIGPVLELRGCWFECSDEMSVVESVILPLDEDATPDPDGDPAPALDYERLGWNLEPYMLPSWLDTAIMDTHGELVSWDGETLIWDVSYDMQVTTDAMPSPRPVTVTVRWYLTPETILDPGFVPRGLHPRVGYLDTWRGLDAFAMHFSLRAPIHYLIKNVPEVYHEPFAAAFDDWNAVFVEQLRQDIFSYEFVAESDPRYATLVAGDIRYHVLEWDLDNKAWYGGLASPAADQRTGETFASGVLIQGPDIVDLYTEWFASAGQPLVAAPDQRRAALFRRARARGHGRSASAARLARVDDVRSRAGNVPTPGDPLGYIFAFDEPPEGETFESYMGGYFRDLVGHELGHVIGLSHNFTGSLGDDPAGLPSDSAMEYTWRGRRHLTRIAGYDEAAVAYGYAGVEPAVDTRYCSDEHLPSTSDWTLSAECSAEDATADPFTFLREERLVRAIDLGIGRTSPGEIPAWSLDEVVEPFLIGAHGMLFYATSAEATAATWTNFFLDPQRPTSVAEIRAYVTAAMQESICDPSIVTHLEASYALDPDAGVAGARTWAGLHTVLAAEIERAGLAVSLCVPADELGFEF